MNITAMYFSGTGTTKKVTAAIADELTESKISQDETAAGENPGSIKAGIKPWQRAADIDFTPPAARREIYRFTPDDLVVFGVPVIAGRVPNVLLKFLDTLQGGGALAVPVVLYGNRNFDDALIELRNILQDRGFYAIGAAAFIGEHSFSRTLGAGRPDAQDMALVEELAHKTAEKVKGLERAPEIPAYVAGCDPIRPYYTPRDRHGEPIKDFLKAKPVTDSDKCVKCGLCARLCPMAAIDPNDVSSVVGKCIKCCACVKKCPKGAKYFDHEGYLYHQHELEELYARRADSEIFIEM